ncbi:MAG TPA: hypothetical protein VGD65_15025 [Chryseosolibacter sp.]
MTLSKLVTALVLLIALPQLLFSQPLSHHGPNEVYGVNDLIFGKENKLFIGTAGGLFESTDLGVTWQRPANFKSSVYQTPSFTINKKTGDLFWYGSSSGAEFFQTKDNGTTWISHLLFIPDLINAFAVYGDTVVIAAGNALQIKRLSDTSPFPTLIPSFTNVLIRKIAFEKNIIVAVSNDRIYYSADRGATWKDRTALSANPVRDLIIVNGNIFLTYSLGGMFVSPDAGASWIAKNSGLVRQNVTDMYLDGDKFYAMTDGANNIYQSVADANSPWTPVSSSPAGEFPNTFAISGNTALAGTSNAIYRSTNLGSSWQKSVTGITDVFRIYKMQISSDGSIWATASHTGIYRKKPTENNFESVITGTNYAETALRGDTLPIAMDHQIRMYNVITGEFGRTISSLNIGLVRDYVEVGAYRFLGTMISGVHRQHANEPWESFNTGLTESDIRDLKNDGQVLFAGTSAGLFKTDVTQNQWSKVTLGANSGGVYQIHVFADKIFVLTVSEVFVSADHGATWQTIEALKNTGVDCFHRNNNQLYASSFGTLYASHDNGTTWSKQVLNGLFTDAMLATNDKLYIGTLEHGIKSLGFNQDQAITFSVADKTMNDPAFMLTATATSGLPVTFSSSDATVLSISASNEAAILKPGTVTITASQPGNMFFKPAEVKRTITISTVVGTEEAMANESRYQLFPNPGSGLYTIHLPRSSGKDVSLSVIDMMGRPVPARYNVEGTVLTFELLDSRNSALTALVKSNAGVVAKRFVNVQ